jgi:hypothetical protein
MSLSEGRPRSRIAALGSIREERRATCGNRRWLQS